MLGVEEGRVGDVGILGREARRLGREGRGGVQTGRTGKSPSGQRKDRLQSSCCLSQHTRPGLQNPFFEFFLMYHVAHHDRTCRSNPISFGP